MCIYIFSYLYNRFKDLEHDVTALSDHNLMKVAMSSCHTLTMIQDELCGDPLDLKMFQATKWVGTNL